MTPVVEAVPNFSEGRDPRFPEAVADAFARAGCHVFHVTSDPDHHRSVITVAGPPEAVEDGAVAAAGIALREIDMRHHQGVHPRVGALDVLPFVPLHGVSMKEVVRLARRAGARIAALGVPVYFYGEASVPPGRGLASIRQGGFEALAATEGDRSGPRTATADGDRPAARATTAGGDRSASRAPAEGNDRSGSRAPADLPGTAAAAAGAPVRRFAHPSAGAVCVGARKVLLAWNVELEGVSLEVARSVAVEVRESGGGFAGVRALGVRLPRQGRLQVSMNMEDPATTDPLAVLRAIEHRVRERGGRVAGVEVIGMIPDALSDPEAARKAAIRGWSEDRLLGRRLLAYLASESPAGRNAAEAGITFPA